ncbi:MAG: hypothetical protein AAGC77_04140 [Pseudomonadota bacterium]
MSETVATPDAKKRRREAILALIGWVLLEGIIVSAAVLVFVSTGNVLILIGGIIVSFIVLGPNFLRWRRDHAPALKTPAAQDGDNV